MAIKIVQPLLAEYRHNFFERVNRRANSNNGVFKIYFSSLKGVNSNIFTKKEIFPWSYYLGETIDIFKFLFWQKGINKINISKKDTLVLSGNPRYLSNFLIFFKARFLGAKVVWWGQFIGSNTSNTSLFIKLLIFQFFDGLIFYTEREKKIYEKLNLIPYKKPTLGINNGIDNSIIKQCRETYNPNERGLRVLFIGRITEKSNFEILIKAFNHEKLNKVCLDVVGKNDYGNSKKKWESKNIIFHGEILDEKKIAKIANKCRIFVYGGSVGLSLVHAMNYGLPCILHDQKKKHMPEIAAFLRNETGTTFSYNNSEDLALVIWRLINDDKKLKKYSEKCLEISSNKFNTENMAEKFFKFLQLV